MNPGDGYLFEDEPKGKSDDEPEVIYIPTQQMEKLRLVQNVKPKKVVIHHHYNQKDFEENYTDRAKYSKVIYIDDEAFYKPGKTPQTIYKS